jgi:integrase
VKKDTPPYVVRLRGKLYFKRRGWPTVMFENQDLGAYFHAEYARILNGTAPKPKAFMVKGLIAAYYRSQKVDGLAVRTKTDYRKFLMRFEKNASEIEVKSIKRKNVIAWRDQLAKTDGPHYANYFVRVLRILFKYAGDIDELPSDFNPAAGVEAVKYAKIKPRPWPPEMIEAARNARGFDDKTRLLFELLYCTGQRVGDVLKASWTDIQGDAIDVSQGKTGVDLVIPLTDTLKDCLKRAERHGKTILTARGKVTPWAYRGAADAMMKLRKEIGAEAYNIHAIRHTVASEIGADGSDDDVMSITGHTTKGMVAHYAGAARQKSRAVKAQKRRE